MEEKYIVSAWYNMVSSPKLTTLEMTLTGKLKGGGNFLMNP